MPWARICDHALDHPKLVALVDYRQPFTLWVWGLSYAQRHLTDGALPADALPPKSAAAAAQLVNRGLWIKTNDGDYQIHDFGDWNDSRETVLKKRAGGRARTSKARAQTTTSVTRYTGPARDAHTPSGVVWSGNSEEQDRDENAREAPHPPPRALPAGASSDVGERAAWLLEHYAVLYAKHRHGAKFLRLGSNLQWMEACTLCETWDDATLVKLVTILLTTDDDWVAKTDRGWKVFVARAQWCAERLAAWETKQRSA